MKNHKPTKIVAALPVAQAVTAKDLQAMMNYLKNFDLKYRGNKSQDGSKK